MRESYLIDHINLNSPLSTLNSFLNRLVHHLCPYYTTLREEMSNRKKQKTRNFDHAFSVPR